jgi:glycopeptide antibiotics resistance protein
MREYRQLSSFINLIPFNFNLSEIPEIVFRQMFQNILLTIHFGFGFKFVAEVRGRGFIWMVLAVVLGVELVQIVISLLLRFPHRVIDVNDAMLNTLGVLVGIGLFSVFARLYLWVTQRLGIPQGGLLAYIYEVASRTQMTRESLHTKMN